tara:strand:+ start:128 stop:1153 length:1026 start_codon:yes stop_codon:yes gene_type:complete
MHDILSENNRDPEKILYICLKNNSYLHKSLIIKKISEENFGFFTKEKIQTNEKLMSIPNKIFISKEIFRNFLMGKECNYFNKELLKTYFNFLPKLNYFKKKHFMFLPEKEKKIAYTFFNLNTPLQKKIKRSFDEFEKLNELEKYIDLIFRSRSFTVRNKEYLLPMLDIVNYEYNSGGLYIDKEEVFFNSYKNIANNEQFFQKYNSKNNPILFFINYSFFPEDYKSCFIPKKFISIPSIISENELSKKNWVLNDQNKMTNNSNIFFEDLNIPDEFNQLLTVFEADNKKQFGKDILNLLLNEINHQNLDKYLKTTDENNLLFMFASSVKQHYQNILQIINKIK